MIGRAKACVMRSRTVGEPGGLALRVIYGSIHEMDIHQWRLLGRRNSRIHQGLELAETPFSTRPNRPGRNTEEFCYLGVAERWVAKQ